MAVAASAKVVTPAVADSDDDDADMDLLLDWRGTGPGTSVGLGLQTLRFKQVKLRPPDAVKTMVPKPQVFGRHEKRNAEVNRSSDKVAFVSLSDDDDPRPTRPRRNDAKAVSTSVKHADVVCLDSDSESERPSINLKDKASAKLGKLGSANFGKVEEPIVGRSWEKAPCSQEVRVVDSGLGPGEPYAVTPPSALSKDGEARNCPLHAKLEENSDKISNENAIRLSTIEVFASPDANAGSSSRDHKIEFISSEERVINFKKILEGAGAHDDFVARSPRRRGNAAEKAAALHVYDFVDDTLLESCRHPPGPALRKCSGKVLAFTSVTSAKSPLSTARESHGELNVASTIIIEDLTTSDDESRNLHRGGWTKNVETVSRGFEKSDLFGEKGTGGLDCAPSQEWLRSEKLSRVGLNSVYEMPVDDDPVSGRLHSLRDTGGSSRAECDNSTKIWSSHTCEGVAPRIRDSRVPLCDLALSDDENTQIPVKRKFTGFAEDSILEERFTDVGAVDCDSQTPILPVGAKGRKRLNSEDPSSAFEAAKAVIESQKAEKQKERGRGKEARNKLKEEEKLRRQEETRKKKEELRQQKEAAKAEAAERRKIEQECVRWKKGKFALENTTVFIDKRIIESRTLGPPLLQQLASAGYTYQVVTNRVDKTIVWTMKKPSEDSKAILDARDSQDEPISNSQLPLEEVEIKYVVVFLDAVEFADMVAEDAVNNHISRIKKEYPGYTMCYLVNNLTRYIFKKEQNQYRTGDRSWKRPNVEQVLAEFMTHHVGVRSRLCIDENEMAEHIVGLTRSLAECPFKPKLSYLTINANGDHLAKSDPHKDVIKRDPWKKALAAIPNISGAAVIAITKAYPTLRSLLNAYLDPTKTVLEKEFLLQDIVKDAALGSARAEGRRVGPVCSKRIYRLLMAQNGNLRTDAAEEGEDYFRDQQC